MYATPIIYPISFLPPQLKQIAQLNPLAYIIEGFRAIWFNEGNIELIWLFISISIIIASLSIGLWLYSKTEKDFVDTV